MAYQTFPWQFGNSNSFHKLLSLYLPPLSGKTVLDIGCNEGFFCAFSKHQGAKRVVGIDANAAFIERAQFLFPEVSFRCMSWEELDADAYDLVLCLSAIHYAEDQEWLLHHLMQRVAPDGLLVLEIGIAPGEHTDFVPVKRAIDTRFFPTQAKLNDMLQSYAVKYIGNSVQQAGDPIPRHVYHVQHKKPWAVLLLGPHYSGKSTAASELFASGLKPVHGDLLLYHIAMGRIEVDPALRELVQYEKGTTFINGAKVMENICQAGLLFSLLDVVLGRVQKKSFLLDLYIPATYHQDVYDYICAADFFTTSVQLNPGQSSTWVAQRTPFSAYETFQKVLEEADGFDEEAYMAAYSDVAEAVATKKMPSARFHYWHFGVKEGRTFFGKNK